MAFLKKQNNIFIFRADHFIPDIRFKSDKNVMENAHTFINEMWCLFWLIFFLKQYVNVIDVV